MRAATHSASSTARQARRPNDNGPFPVYVARCTHNTRCAYNVYAITASNTKIGADTPTDIGAVRFVI